MPRGRPKLSPDRRRHPAPNLQLTDAEYVRCAVRAERQGLGITAYARGRALSCSPGSPASREAIAEVSMLGGRLNGMARHANTFGAIADRAAVTEAIAGILRVAEAVAGGAAGAWHPSGTDTQQTHRRRRA